MFIGVAIKYTAYQNNPSCYYHNFTVENWTQGYPDRITLSSINMSLVDYTYSLVQEQKEMDKLPDLVQKVLFD